MEDLRSGIERLKQAKAHMREANGIVSDCISQLKELEEENAELRGEHDSYMKLPLDADGVPIHVGDVLYSRGNECRVVSITVKADEACVGAHTDEGVFLPSVNPKYLSRENLEPLEPEPDDSWEKLEEDSSVGAQDYCANWLGIDVRKTLTSDDDRAFAKDIIRRAKKLAGIEEEAQR